MKSIKNKAEMRKTELYENIYEKQFSFGKNWEEFLKTFNLHKLESAKASLTDFTGLNSFKDKTFLDIGCGSGLFSLAANSLNAEKVISIDVDDNSIKCADFLRSKHNISPEKWIIKKGSILDEDFLRSLPKADIVYSWGVLHHTGKMWQAMENITKLLKEDGLLYIAIYNDFKGFPSSKTWHKIKKFYSNSPEFIRKIMNVLYAFQILSFRLLRFKNPIKYAKNYGTSSCRGMSFYTDVKDWLGGYPYEFSTAEKIIDFYDNLNFEARKKRAVNGTGCNEFLFVRKDGIQ
jgi:2-polyprenyl-3-methyl-5-hydroxy-6-metoxy-1,4-benzoquinol methylase